MPRWVPLWTITLSALGLATSVYLTVEHYTTASVLACPETGVVNCQKVTTSAQSTVYGVPLAVLGIVFFAVMLVAGLPKVWRAGHPVVLYGRLAHAVVGVGFVFYLVYAELFILDAICLWCTVVHALTLGLFAVVAFGTAARTTK